MRRSSPVAWETGHGDAVQPTTKDTMGAATVGRKCPARFRRAPALWLDPAQDDAR